MGNYSRVCYTEENKGHSCSFLKWFWTRKETSFIVLWNTVSLGPIYNTWFKYPAKNFFSVELEKVKKYCPKISWTGVTGKLSDKLIKTQFSRKYVVIDTGKGKRGINS